MVVKFCLGSKVTFAKSLYGGSNSVFSKFRKKYPVRGGDRSDFKNGSPYPYLIRSRLSILKRR